MYHIKKVMWERNLVFSAKIIHCDFELALVQAISFSFQEIKIFGCFFHYCQCIYRQVNALGLTTLYKTNREIYRWIRLAMALPFASKLTVDVKFGMQNLTVFFKNLTQIFTNLLKHYNPSMTPFVIPF